MKLPLFGNSSRIPFVPDVHRICLCFYDCYGNKSNTCNNWEPGGGDVGLYFQLGEVYGACHIENTAAVKKIKENHGLFKPGICELFKKNKQYILQMRVGSKSCDGDDTCDHFSVD